MIEFHRKTLFKCETRLKTDWEAMGSPNWAYLLMSFPEKKTESWSPEVMMREWIWWSSEGDFAVARDLEIEGGRICGVCWAELEDWRVLMRKERFLQVYGRHPFERRRRKSSFWGWEGEILALSFLNWRI